MDLSRIAFVLQKFSKHGILLFCLLVVYLFFHLLLKTSVTSRCSISSHAKASTLFGFVLFQARKHRAVNKSVTISRSNELHRFLIDPPQSRPSAVWWFASVYTVGVSWLFWPVSWELYSKKTITEWNRMLTSQGGGVILITAPVQNFYRLATFNPFLWLYSFWGAKLSFKSAKTKILISIQHVPAVVRQILLYDFILSFEL